MSYALRSLLGLLLLAGAGALIAQYLNGAFNQLPWQMLQLSPLYHQQYLVLFDPDGLEHEQS